MIPMPNIGWVGRRALSSGLLIFTDGSILSY
jgi:hypothetical protein